MTKNIFDFNRLFDTPERRARLMRLLYMIGFLFMMFGFVLIILSLINPNLLP